MGSLVALLLSFEIYSILKFGHGWASIGFVSGGWPARQRDGADLIEIYPQAIFNSTIIQPNISRQTWPLHPTCALCIARFYENSHIALSLLPLQSSSVFANRSLPTAQHRIKSKKQNSIFSTWRRKECTLHFWRGTTQVWEWMRRKGWDWRHGE